MSRTNQKCKIELSEAEMTTLEQMALNHPHRDFRVRATGLLHLVRGGKPKEIGDRLGVSHQAVYNWSHAWRNLGLIGLLGGHAGGRKTVLPAALLDTAEAIARSEALSLPQIAKRVEATHQCALPCCLDTLSNGLKARGFSFKRTRFSLKKNASKRISSACKVPLVNSAKAPETGNAT